MNSVKSKFKLIDGVNKTAVSQLLQYYWIKIMQNEGNKYNNIKVQLPENLNEN